MKLPAEQLVLDTNILVHLLRSDQTGQSIEREYEVGRSAYSAGDLWIAATTLVVSGVLLTMDADFDHLSPTLPPTLPLLRVERVRQDQIGPGTFRQEG